MADLTLFAHSAGADGKTWEPMTQHVNRVADLAASNGRAFGAEEECRFAGILHDLGKYGARFQGRLHGTEKHVDHWSAGAFEAILMGPKGFAAALAIQGHHIGLQRGDRDSLAGLDISSLLTSHPLGCKTLRRRPRRDQGPGTERRFQLVASIRQLLRLGHARERPGWPDASVQRLAASDQKRERLLPDADAAHASPRARFGHPSTSRSWRRETSWGPAVRQRFCGCHDAHLWPHPVTD